jgi:hypothetical protein
MEETCIVRVLGSTYHTGKYLPHWEVLTTLGSTYHTGKYLPPGKYLPHWEVLTTLGSTYHSGKYLPYWEVLTILCDSIKLRAKFTQGEAMNSQMGSRDTTLLFLEPRR